MTPRLATRDDTADIAALHVQAWEETYTGLLPRSEFDRRNIDQRLLIWGRILENGMPVSYLPGIGFAHMGRHRSDDRRSTYPLELYSFYTLRHSHGRGAAQALLAHALGKTFAPFTAEVLKGNARATGFYQKIGGSLIGQTEEQTDDRLITNLHFGWMEPPRLDIPGD